MDPSNNCLRREAEYQKLTKLLNFRFPNSFKKYSLFTAVGILIFLIGYKFWGANDLLVKDVCRTLMLVFLLIASLSKDKFEDEYLNYLKSQSYVISFILAIAYSIGLPIIAFVIDIIITKATGDGTINFHEVSGFEVMFMLVCFQLLFYEVAKLLSREK